MKEMVVFVCRKGDKQKIVTATTAIAAAKKSFKRAGYHLAPCDGMSFVSDQVIVDGHNGKNHHFHFVRNET